MRPVRIAVGSDKAEGRDRQKLQAILGCPWQSYGVDDTFGLSVDKKDETDLRRAAMCTVGLWGRPQTIPG